MMLENRIRELSRLDGGAEPVLSMYVATRRGDGDQRERIRLFLKNEITRLRGEMNGNGHEKLIESGIDKLESVLAAEIDPATRGLAVFIEPQQSKVIPIELPVEVEPQLSLSPRPALRQLVRARDLHPPVLIVMVDARSAQMWRMEMDQIVRHVERESDEFDHRNQRNVTADSVNRHQQEHVDRHLRETAEFVERWLNDRAIAGLVLSGQDRNVSNFRSNLSQTAQERIIGLLHLDIRASAEDVRNAVRELLRERRATIARQRLEQLKESGELGLLGAEAVCAAANQRRLEALVLSGNASAQGWRCTSCGIIGSNIPLGCPACSEPVVTLDLIEELVAHAEAESADVVFVDGPSLLDQREGIGAVLRF